MQFYNNQIYSMSSWGYRKYWGVEIGKELGKKWYSIMKCQACHC
jgi:hypothetical protein